MPVIPARPPASPRSHANSPPSPRSQAKTPRPVYPPEKPLSPSKLRVQPENLGDNSNRGDSSALIIRRETVVKQLLDFATKWSQAAAPAKPGARGAVDKLATSLTSLHLKPAPTAEPALKALEAARAVSAHMIAELADVTLRLIEALVVEPAAAAAKQEQERKQESARRSLMRRRNRAPVRTGFEREVAVDDDDDDDDDDESELEWEDECLAPPAFKRHCLEWATANATGGRNAPDHMAGGVDYLLRALLDVHRLPLPSASDPLLLRWFESEPKDAPLGLLARPAPPRRARMAAAEAALLGLLSTRQHEALRAAERARAREPGGWGQKLRAKRQPVATPTSVEGATRRACPR